jgi:hypothetical protein
MKRRKIRVSMKRITNLNKKELVDATAAKTDPLAATADRGAESNVGNYFQYAQKKGEIP